MRFEDPPLPAQVRLRVLCPPLATPHQRQGPPGLGPGEVKKSEGRNCDLTRFCRRQNLAEASESEVEAVRSLVNPHEYVERPTAEGSKELSKSVEVAYRWVYISVDI